MGYSPVEMLDIQRIEFPGIFVYGEKTGDIEHTLHLGLKSPDRSLSGKRKEFANNIKIDPEYSNEKEVRYYGLVENFTAMEQALSKANLPKELAWAPRAVEIFTKQLSICAFRDINFARLCAAKKDISFTPAAKDSNSSEDGYGGITLGFGSLLANEAKEDGAIGAVLMHEAAHSLGRHSGIPLFRTSLKWALLDQAGLGAEMTDLLKKRNYLRADGTPINIYPYLASRNEIENCIFEEYFAIMIEHFYGSSKMRKPSPLDHYMSLIRLDSAVRRSYSYDLVELKLNKPLDRIFSSTQISSLTQIEKELETAGDKANKTLLNKGYGILGEGIRNLIDQEKDLLSNLHFMAPPHIKPPSARWP